jgi:hypothetical protein
MKPQQIDPAVFADLAAGIEARGETIEQWASRMQARVAALMQARLEAGCPPDLPSLTAAIEPEVAKDAELSQYLRALALQRQREEILAERGSPERGKAAG